MSIRLDLVTTDLEDNACHIGTTFIVDLAILNECTELPCNLNGYTATMRIYDKIDETIILTIAGSIDEALTGVISFEIDVAESSNLIAGLYSHHIEASIGTNIYRFATGDFEVAE